jgi:hypothetical protein
MAIQLISFARWLTHNCRNSSLRQVSGGKLFTTVEEENFFAKSTKSRSELALRLLPIGILPAALSYDIKKNFVFSIFTKTTENFSCYKSN